MTFCAENENCYFRKKVKQSEADLKDFISCHVPGCNRQFHVKCVGFNKTTKEKYKYSFVCTRCNNFLHTLRSIISEEISNQFNRMANCDSTRPACSEQCDTKSDMILKNHDDTKNGNSEAGTKDSTADTGKSDAATGNSMNSVSDNGETLNNDNDTGRSVDDVCDSAEAENSDHVTVNSVDGANEIFGGVMDVAGDCGGSTQDKEEKVSHLVLSTIKANNDLNITNSVKPFYLCHIEKELTLEDVKLILEDNKIKFDKLNMSEIEGDFTSRKYIKIIGSVKDNFKFKLDLENSPLKSAWYHKMNPPASRKNTTHSSPKPSNSTVIRSVANENSSGDKIKRQLNYQPHKIETQNLNRDKILMLHNHHMNTSKNNKINSNKKDNALNSVKSFLEDILKEKIKR